MNNTEFNITYRRKLSESYQVVTFEKGKLKIHELEMLRRNQLAGFLPMEFMLADGKGQFWYNITGLQALDDLRKAGRFQEETLKNLVEGLDRILKTAEQYALREESIRFDDIFFSPDGTRVYFGYLPLNTGQEEPAREKLVKLLDELIKTADYRDNEYVTYLFSLYEALGRENAGIGTLLDIPLRKQGLITSEEEEDIEESRSLLREMKEEKEESTNRSIDQTVERIREKAKNRYLDAVWGARKKIRSYTHLKPEKRKEVSLIRPEEYREESRNTQYLGAMEETGDGITGAAGDTGREESNGVAPVGRIRFQDSERASMPLTQSRYVVGKRKEYANLVVEDASVSRVHALIVREEDGYYLEDLNSLNGTFLNGSLLELKEKVRLKSRDEIGVGHSTLIFEET